MSLRETASRLFRCEEPFAITMWDFSWLERRWPGAGYEDWDQALSELTDRGYNAVRIDPYPHLLAKDICRVWTLNPVWNLQNWGAPAVTRICLERNLQEFLRACRRHQVRVGLSSWFRQDADHSEMDIRTPEDHAGIWIRTMDYIREWGELDNILYVDFCNEFPLDLWSPFLRRGATGLKDPFVVDWMKRTVCRFKEAYPEIPVTFSFCYDFDENMDVSYLDFLEPHIWMTSNSDFYKKVGYYSDRFDDKGYTNLALNGEMEYLMNQAEYDRALVDGIFQLARWAEKSGRPLVTTECWAVVDYKDWPLLNWGWILDLNRLGVSMAAATGCWAGMATSNFCGPQFVGMWREKEWHREMTGVIRSSSLKDR
ncbi:MAG: cellulase [Firmicutes bacterium]|nr:cellulase [Bacillota bacterium]